MQKAEGMSRLFVTDPQMQLPVRPRFSEDYLLMPVNPTALIVFGGERSELLRGKSATSLLPRLFPLLDGTRTIAEVHAALPGVKESVVRDAVSLLYFRGLLEEGREDASPRQSDVVEAQLTFFGRYTDVSRSARNRFESQRRLSNATVTIFAPLPIGSLLREALQRSGIGRVDLFAADERSTATSDELRQAAMRSNLLIAFDSNVGDASTLDRLDAVCRSEGKSWLRAALDSVSLQIGPMFNPVETACYRCFREFSPAGTAQASLSADSLAMDIAVSHVELTAIMDLTQLFTPILSDRIQCLELSTGKVEELKLTRLPRCGRCGTAEARLPVESVDDLVSLFHLDTNHHWHGASVKSHQMHYSEQVSKVSMGAYKVYRTAPKFALPSIEELPLLATDLFQLLREDRPVPFEREITIADVAQLCGWSARWRTESLPMRFVPSGGGMCSSDLYVLVWNVEGLVPGVYHYDGRQHRLEQLRPGSPIDALREAVPSTVRFDRSGFAIVQTAQLQRVFSKYGNRAYRYVHLDAGVMTKSLRLTASSLRLPSTVIGQFVDDGIANLLEIAPAQEIPTQVLIFG